MPPPPPFAQARACPSTDWALNRSFQEFLGPLLFVVLNAGLGVCDALVEGKGGSFMSVTSTNGSSMPQHAAAPDSGSYWWGF